MTETTERPTQTDARPQQHADMLAQALQQPGVREFIEVYESYKAVEAAARPYQQAMATKKIVSTTNTSGPVVR